VTNHYYTNSPITVITTNLAVVTNGLVGSLTNIVTTNYLNGGVGGDFFIVPLNWCNYSIVATQLQTLVLSTNQFVAINSAAPDLGQKYSQTLISAYTNSTFLVQAYLCDTVASTPALRQGIEKVKYIRANYDSLLGQFFQPFTNNYQMVKITNGQPVIEYYQRVVQAPDLVFSARDLTAGPAGSPTAPSVSRALNYDQSTILNGLAGPGVINPNMTITFNKSGPVYQNSSPFLMAGPSGTSFSTLWGSFDGSTNEPIVYPTGTSIDDLQAKLLMQVSPATLPAATQGVPYTLTTFTCSGGVPPYTWAAPNVSSTVPGMSFTGGSTNLLSGTPSAAGVFSFTLQVTDSLNRAVNLNYTLTVQ
jgi:hypothetical protein